SLLPSATVPTRTGRPPSCRATPRETTRPYVLGGSTSLGRARGPPLALAPRYGRPRSSARPGVQKEPRPRSRYSPSPSPCPRYVADPLLQLGSPRTQSSVCVSAGQP